MSDSKVKLRYTGPTGDSNADVARATGKSGLLEHGEQYEVPKELAFRLLMTVGWEEVAEGGKTGGKGLAGVSYKDNKKRPPSPLSQEFQEFVKARTFLHPDKGVGMTQMEDSPTEEPKVEEDDSKEEDTTTSEGGEN